MRKQVVISGMCLFGSLCSMSPALAQNAPGEDPLILTRRVAVQMLPLGAARTSTPIEAQAAMPAWMKAKVVRYEAKASSAQNEGILTDKDITRSATSDGFKKTCVQEIGSTSISAGTAGPGKAGITNNQQIVVLKGDLVNICK